MKRAWSVDNLLNAKFRTLDFEGAWLDSCGCPELAGSWFIYGPPKNGKTSFAMLLAKYLTRFGRVAYDSVEEGFSQSIRDAMVRADMKEVGRRLILLDKEDVGELVDRLSRRKSPEIVVIDSIQFLGLQFEDYKRLKQTFPDKLFIYISHVDGRHPDGNVAKRVMRDANIFFRIEGFVAYPTSRYGGGAPFTISEEKARDYWSMDNDRQ